MTYKGSMAFGLQTKLTSYQDREEEIKDLRRELETLESKHVLATQADFGVSPGKTVTVPSMIDLILTIVEHQSKEGFTE